MKIIKNKKVAFGMLTIASLFGIQSAMAEFPERPVTIVVPYPAGGATDVIARILSSELPNVWSQPVPVENRPGAGTTVASASVARSEGDGHTLYMTTAAHTISASLHDNLSYSPLDDFAPVTLVATIPLVLVVSSAFPVDNISEFTEAARDIEGGLTFASTGYGTPQHLTGALFSSEAGVDLVHVPYQGDAPMLTALLGAQADFAFVTLSAALPYLKDGDLKAIAVAHPQRVEAIPNIPTFEESGMPGFVAATWFGMLAPASTPEELRQKIYEDVSGIVADPKVTQRLQEMGGEVNNSPPQDFADFIAAEAERWAEGVRVSGAEAN